MIVLHQISDIVQKLIIIFFEKLFAENSTIQTNGDRYSTGFMALAFDIRMLQKLSLVLPRIFSNLFQRKKLCAKVK